MADVTSVRNRRVTRLVALHRRRGRREAGRYLVEGPHAVGEAVADGVVAEIWATPDLAPGYADTGVPVVAASEHVLERIATTTTPQGVVAIARTGPAELSTVVGAGLLVVLHEATDPGNVGTVIRTADALGAGGVVLTAGSADPYGPKAVRAAAGSTTHLPLVVDAPLDSVLDACTGAAQPVAALDATATTTVGYLGGIEGPLALLLGNEAHGLPASALRRSQLRVAIPIAGRAESLNLAAAAAIATFVSARPLR